MSTSARPARVPPRTHRLAVAGVGVALVAALLLTPPISGQVGTVAVRAPAVGAVALTFDDGPAPGSTDRILDILAREQVKATFFLVGSAVSWRGDLAARIHAEGHQLGNHTWAHARLPVLDTANVRWQIRNTQALIEGYTGARPTVFRFPYGASDPRTRAIADEFGLRSVHWTIDPQDWLNPPASAIAARVLTAVRPGRLNVVLLHDGGAGGRPATAAALGTLIPELKRRGYTFALA